MHFRTVLLCTALIAGACATGTETGTGNSGGDVALPDSLVLERTVCFGLCPAYRLRISSSGHVLFVPTNPSGQTFQDTIPRAAFANLVARLEGAGFRTYPSVIQGDSVLCARLATDHPSSHIALYGASGTREVRDYTGCYAAENDARSIARLENLRRLDELIDSIAGSSRWVPRR